MRADVSRVVLALIVAGMPVASHAVATDCGTARESFGQARDRVEQRLRVYADCVRASDGEEMCAREFKQLKAAQHSLENAGNDVHVNCAPE